MAFQNDYDNAERVIFIDNQEDSKINVKESVLKFFPVSLIRIAGEDYFEPLSEEISFDNPDLSTVTVPNKIHRTRYVDEGQPKTYNQAGGSIVFEKGVGV